MKDIDDNENTDYFEPDYFSQEMILDYIDGRLSQIDAALFEQHMQEDETLLLAVEGIRDFYADEQKDRFYLEGLMSHSETGLKEALMQEAVKPKVVALATRRRWLGIAVAACVAILMVFSLPQLFPKTSNKGQKTAISYVDPKKDKDEDEGRSSDLTPQKRGGQSTSDTEQSVETNNAGGNNKNAADAMTILRPSQLPQSADEESTSLKDDRDKQDKKRKISGDPVIKNKAAQGGGKLYHKRENTNQLNTLTGTTAGITSIEKNSDKEMAVAGKLHLWVFTNRRSAEFTQMKQMGEQIQANTGLKLEAQKLNEQQYNATQLQRLMKAQKVASNDVVWVHYLGQKKQQNEQEKTAKKYGRNTKSAASMPIVNNGNINAVLGQSKASLKILTVDQGTAVLNGNDLLKDKVNPSKNESKTNFNSHVGGGHISLPQPNTKTYKKLFLKTKGMYTNAPVKDNYQGVYTNELLLNLQKAGREKSKKVNWKSLLRKTDKGAKKKNRKLKKNFRKYNKIRRR